MIMGHFLSTAQFGGQQNGVSNVCHDLKYLHLICVIVWRGLVASTVTPGVIGSQVVKYALPMSGQLILSQKRYIPEKAKSFLINNSHIAKWHRGNQTRGHYEWNKHPVK